MTVLNLCKICSEIDFYALIYTTNNPSENERDTGDYSSTSGDGRFDARGRKDSASLGTVKSLRGRAKNCSFCALIVEAVRRVTKNAEVTDDDEVDESDEISEDEKGNKVSEEEFDEEENDQGEKRDEEKGNDKEDSNDSTNGGRIGEKNNKTSKEEGDEEEGDEEASDGTENNADHEGDDKSTNSKDEGRVSLLMSEKLDDETRCQLEVQSFCKLSGVEHNGKVRDVYVNRLSVSFNPDPWEFTDERRSTINFQAFWGDKNGDLVKGSGRKVSSVIDFTRVKSWLACCEADHECNNPSWGIRQNQPKFLRVIDVIEQCIVDAPPDCRYLALSYVWGRPPSPEKGMVTKTVTANIGQLREPNAMVSVTLPKTIRDSMTPTAALGERYLWVDAFCIVQDDIAEVVTQTTSMDLIYSRAILTVIAATGYDADHGLPGVLPGTRNIVQEHVQVGESMAVMQTTAQGLGFTARTSIWNQRGWTYQERLLSKRVLIFTEHLLFWACESSIWDEETILEPIHPIGWVDPSKVTCNDISQKDVAKFTLPSLPMYITQYSRRTFTFGSDALPAFIGIVQRVQALTGEKFHWGLPCTLFEQSLTWKGGEDRRLEEYSIMLADRTVRHVLYPSWSWTGWTGAISPCKHNSKLHKDTLAGVIRSELAFHMLMSDGSLQAICESRISPNETSKETEERHSGESGQISDRSSLWKGATEVKGPITVTSKTARLEVVGSARDQRLSLQRQMAEVENSTLPADAKEEILKRIAIGLPQVYETDVLISPTNGALPAYDTGHIVFWTSRAIIQTWIIGKPNSSSRGRIYIPNGSRELEIELRLAPYFHYHFKEYSHSGLPIRQEKSKLSVSDWKANKRKLKPNKAAKGSRLLNFIVISRRYIETSGNYTRDGLNLLVVELDEQNVAHRRGLAWMSEDDWISLDREWKLIILR